MVIAEERRGCARWVIRLIRGSFSGWWCWSGGEVGVKSRGKKFSSVVVASDSYHANAMKL